MIVGLAPWQITALDLVGKSADKTRTLYRPLKPSCFTIVAKAFNVPEYGDGFRGVAA